MANESILVLAPSGRPAREVIATDRTIQMARATNNARDPWGTPNFDPNYVVTPLQRRGSAATPGVYDEMLTYPVIAKAVAAVEEQAIATAWSIDFPKGMIPTAHEEEFLAFCRRAILEHPEVIPGLGITGLDNLIPHMLRQEWYGFGLFVPTFSYHDPSDPSCTVQWYPTRPSAINKWNPDFETGGYVSALFATSTGSSVLTRDKFIHFARSAMPGEMEGVSRIRPLMIPFENVKQILLDAAIFDTMRNGWLDVAYGPGSEGPADQARMVQGVGMVQAGATRAVLHKDTEKWQMLFPTGTPPDVIARVEFYDRQMRELLSQSLGSVGDKGGSLALGAAARESDESGQSRWIARAINQSARAMMHWIAEQVGYIGRVVPDMTPTAVESAASAAAIQTFLGAARDGLVTVTPADQGWIRAGLGAPELPQANPESETGTGPDAPANPLLVGSLQAAVTILTTPGMSEVAQRILLEAAGLSPDKAREASQAQGAMSPAATTPAPAQPLATAPTAAPTAAPTEAPRPEPAELDASAQGVPTGALLPLPVDHERTELAAAMADADLAELAGDVPDYAVPDAVQTACRAALDAHAAMPAQKRSTDTAAIQVARDLARGVRIRWSRVLAMLQWMERDAVRAKRAGTDLDADTGRVAQAYRLRGGAAAVRWLRDVYRQHADGAHMRAVRLAADDVDTTPTDGMVAEAERGLAWRREHGRGGTEVGVARARDIAGRRSLSPDTVRRMVSYFARHEVDKQGSGWSPGESGYPSAGRIAWALWGGDAGQTWASKVARQLEARAELAATDSDDGYEVEGADGKAFTLYRPLRPEEQCVAWVTLAAERDTADETMTREIAKVADEHRKALWAASADGWQPGEAEGIDAEFTRRYRAVIDRYTAQVGEAAANAAAQEALRAVRAAGGASALPTVTPSAATASTSAAEALGAAKAQASDLMAGQASQTMAQRVSGELANAIIGGATEETWESRITPDGLAQPAKAAGTQAEAAARFEAYADPPKLPGRGQPKLMPYSVIRTSIPDRARCRHCREMDTGKPIVLADVEVSDGVYAIPELPDPECEGAPNCRCGWLVTYRAVDTAATDDEGVRRAA